ncbi:MAG: hypothetical protein JW902_12225, partial [Syntrophaceae bacterium]|nr:hypothetical protein [Syntrophaceae bacterium]
MGIRKEPHDPEISTIHRRVKLGRYPHRRRPALDNVLCHRCRRIDDLFRFLVPVFAVGVIMYINVTKIVDDFNDEHEVHLIIVIP